MQRIRLFLCGDVMTGRGVDQVLPCPCDPRLHESYVQSALDYVELTEAAHGSIPRGVAPSYIWGTALDELKSSRPDARIINLETSITRCEDFAPKGINYRMSPENAECLSVFGIDCCVLANNHVLDWGRAGLIDTLRRLERLQIKTAGAGRNLRDAAAPAVIGISGKGRVLVISLALPESGVPRSWAATSNVPGVNFLADLSEASAVRLCEQIAQARRPGDIVVVSIHWGLNWGYDIPREQQCFAHALIDDGKVSVVHGHSSHHAKGIEVYRGRLILYGCGDFLNDYEGISAYEQYRDDLALMYFVDLEPGSGKLAALEIVPLQIRQFRLVRPSREDVDWVWQTLDRESRPFGTSVATTGESRLAVAWLADQ